MTRTFWSSPALPKPSLRMVGIVAFGWLCGFLVLAVLLSVVAEVGSALATWCLVAGVSGAVAHALLLQSPRFRRLQGNRILVLWLAAMSLAVAWSAGYALVSPTGPARDGMPAELVFAALYAAVPLLFASVAANWLTEHAGA